LVGQTLTCEPGTWSGGLIYTFSYQWWEDGGEIAGATEQTYVPGNSVVGHQLTCAVQAESGHFAPSTAISAPVTVLAPAATIIGSPVVGNTIACETSILPDVKSVQWLEDGQPTGPQGLTWALSAELAGHGIACMVSYDSSPDVTSPVEIVSAASGPAPSPPVNVTAPTITGAVKSALTGAYLAGAGAHLSCNPGTWTGASSLTETWYADIPLTGHITGLRPFGTQREQFATGGSVTVPDYPAAPLARGGPIETTAIECVVTAVGQGGASINATVSGGTSDYVYLAVSRPVLTRLCRLGLRLTSCVPTIQHLGYGKTNVCTEGSWLHYPTRYRVRWYAEDTRGSGSARLVHQGTKLHMPQSVEHEYLYCRVSASNSAGSTSVDSAGYVVPVIALDATGGPQIRVEVPSPLRIDPSQAAVGQSSPITNWELGCFAPRFNLPVDHLHFTWQVYQLGFTGVAPVLVDTIAKPSESDPSGTHLAIDTSVSPANWVTFGGKGRTSGTFDERAPLVEPIRAEGGTYAVCTVTASAGTKTYTSWASVPFYSSDFIASWVAHVDVTDPSFGVGPLERLEEEVEEGYATRPGTWPIPGPGS
jgi:hypothetical protein